MVTTRRRFLAALATIIPAGVAVATAVNSESERLPIDSPGMLTSGSGITVTTGGVTVSGSSSLRVTGSATLTGNLTVYGDTATATTGQWISTTVNDQTRWYSAWS